MLLGNSFYSTIQNQLAGNNTKDKKQKETTTPPKRKKSSPFDFAELKLEYFGSDMMSLSEFLRSRNINKYGGIGKKIKGWTKEKEAWKMRIFENAKREMEMNMKAKTRKFYDNMRNVMMSHAQNQITMKEIEQKDGKKVIVPVFDDIKEAKEAIHEVRIFNGDTNNIRDFGIRDNDDGLKIANVQFVFSDDDEEGQ